jgi:hypothetical protein
MSLQWRHTSSCMSPAIINRHQLKAQNCNGVIQISRVAMQALPSIVCFLTRTSTQRLPCSTGHQRPCKMRTAPSRIPRSALHAYHRRQASMCSSSARAGALWPPVPQLHARNVARASSQPGCTMLFNRCMNDLSWQVACRLTYIYPVVPDAGARVKTPLRCTPRRLLGRDAPLLLGLSHNAYCKPSSCRHGLKRTLFGYIAESLRR